MKNFAEINRALVAKKRLLIPLFLSFFIFVLAPVQANDFLEIKNHYEVSTFNGPIHIKVPVFSRGGKNYYVRDTSYTVYPSYGSPSITYKHSLIYFTRKNAPTTKIPLFYFSGEHNSSGPSGNDKVEYGYAWMRSSGEIGSLVIANESNDAKYTNPNDGVKHRYSVMKKEEIDNDMDYVTWLEVDWYPPASMSLDTFNIGADVYITSVGLGFDYTKNWTLKTNLTGINNMIDPQLMEPYFYAVKEDHKAGYGCAAIPYSLFYEPISYTTSLSSDSVITSERADNIYVQTTDNVQSNFNATFTVYYNKADNITRLQTTPSISIPAYHRVYDLTATEEVDSLGTFTGNNVLQWIIRNPNAVDLVENDYFEVQRAMKQDFSDAETVAVEPMERGENKGTYTFQDKSRSTWTGNATVSESDTVDIHVSTTLNNYELLDSNDEPLALLDVKLTADKLISPGVPVYYRVRRASSAVWGWEHPFAKAVSLTKHNFLAPLAETQPAYTKDANYDENHKVHFAIHLDNKQVQYETPSLNDCSLSYEVVEDLRSTVDLKMNVIPASGSTLHTEVYATVYDRDGNETKSEWKVTNTESIVAPKEGRLVVRHKCSTCDSWQTNAYVLDKNSELTIVETKQTMFITIYSVHLNMVTSDVPAIDVSGRMAVVEPALKDSLLKQLNNELANSFGRCMWDKTARLVLVRSSVEHPDIKTEFIIPQDSIRRQADGSWIASYTDVANQACTHYTYAVRIDQSAADLHVQDSVDLQPKALSGEELYYDEAATITSFTATQGAAQTELKRGVLLNWQPSSDAVDEYVLLRKAVGSTASADTLYTGLDITYLDLTAVPDVHYDYTIVARYECNGKHSENSAETQGWRTPYGEIRGAILMPDNSGIAGVQVALQKEGTVVSSLITDASGTFRFDSLLYDIAGSTDYVIIPTASYGTFRYNNTSAGTAAITLSADNAVALGINFENADGVRLSGRALYDLSTIPVAGAMFVLNGDTVRRNGAPLTTGVDGNFELTLTASQPYTLQIIKPGHTFVNDGYLEVTTGERQFALTKPLDGVRFYDQTKVRLVGRVAGGIDQRDMPAAFGLGTNNLGDNLSLVLQLEGDNTAHFVHDPQDLTRDTLMNTFDQKVYITDPLSAVKERTVGTTSMLTEKKRITIYPDVNTGEFAVDLYPVKYKVIQATATGYATLFASGQASETFDLTNAPLISIDPVQGSDSVHYNAVYDRIYRSPVQLSLSQYIYGMKRDGLGEPEMAVEGLTIAKQKVDLYTTAEDGTVSYLLGYPLYYNNRQYQFEAFAYEDYRYNNDASGKLDRVPQRGGQVVIHNGLHNTKNSKTLNLDEKGKNLFFLAVDNLNTEISGTGALNSVSAVLQMEGASIETTGFQSFVVGSRVAEKELTSTEADIHILDIVRDPGGAGSSAWVESGTTYSFSYTENLDAKVGLELTPEYGGMVSRDLGVYMGSVGAGSYVGSNFSVGRTVSFTLPIVASYSWGYKYTYNFTTTERISTSSKKNKSGIGANADVFVGTTMSMLSGKAKSIAIIDDSLFAARQPAIQAGAMRVLAQGTDINGHGYHLVTGEKVVMGSTIGNTFAWSQHYITNTVIPKLALEAYNLLERFPDQATAQAAANTRQEAVYWYIDSLSAVNLQDTLLANSYKMILPQNSTKAYFNRVAALQNMINHWLGVLYDNEMEKVKARESGLHVGTYSVNYNNGFSHSDSYTATDNVNWLPVGWTALNQSSKIASKAMTSFIGSAANSANSVFEESLDILEKLNDKFTDPNKTNEPDFANAFETLTAESKWKLKVNPVFDFSTNYRESDDHSRKKSTGFTLSADDQGDITVSVYRAQVDSVWNRDTYKMRDKVGIADDDSYSYGSYVFFTEAGNTFCVHEQEEKTQFYQPGTVLGNPTVMIAKPELSIDMYEQANVPADQPAIFNLEIRNGGSQHYGMAGSGTSISLLLVGESNPNGAKVTLNGINIMRPVSFYLEPGKSITQVLEVERGLVDDYNNLRLFAYLNDCGVTSTNLDFSVHFLPESSPVALAAPRQGWVMNTLSPKDSLGYYLPIDINGFNIRHKNFDHIEFQYKLASQSDDDWTNMCSFYADDSLYNLASGNKAMIENGRITPFRFYGERDPMEQQYDLRAVSFCRHGSGFVTKSSPIISGTKDTRPPRVFGQPEPANAILGVGDNLKLRFNEAIAGNYLDEDNNFQLLGRTNATGITAGTSVHFDGSDDSYVTTKVSRTLSGRSISLDMLVKPATPNEEAIFFTHGEGAQKVTFGKSADNRLYISVAGNNPIYSKTVDPMLDFTRVIATYNAGTNEVRFYVGTRDVTEINLTNSADDIDAKHTVNTPLIFGQGFNGNMLEARIWTKALTQEEVAATHLKRLTGYERELAAYYPMNEGKGTTLTDKANGATLYMHGATWTNRQSFSLHLNKDQRVQLNGNVLSRSKVYDFTLMFWFKAQEDGTLFSSDKLQITNDKLQITDADWHHVVLSVNRTHNNASVFVDGQLISQQPSDSVPGITGAMYLGGDGFEGNIDEFVIFEQALPKSFIEQYGNAALYGDEIGLMALLSFEELQLNASGVMESVFSINDQRVFKDANGKVVKKVVPLVINQPNLADLADRANYAPISDQGKLTKLNFDWAFNNDELLINLNMADREINKQSVYVTVRDVEDLHGNPMVSPATWTAFVDKNALKWEYHQITLNMNDNTDASSVYDIQIINNSGKRHQYSIESLPAWLTLNRPSGAMDPMEEKTLRFTFSHDVPVGVYSDIIYLSDEDGLLDPLRVEYTVKAVCPYSEPERGKYNMNMSICGQVLINDTYDTDANDKVIALYRNECIGMANVTFDNLTNKSEVFLTVYGDSTMIGTQTTFQLWQASTGKTYLLTPSSTIKFRHGAIYGCGNETPIVFTASGSQTQAIELNPGWNWISFNLNLQPATAPISKVLAGNEPWTTGDIIKNPATQHFVTYSETQDAFLGDFGYLRYIYTYMVYCKNGNTLRVSGDELPADSMRVLLRGDSSWSALPCLLNQTTPITEALADYYEDATPGDLIKAHDRFAVFSSDRKWVGDLTALRPGEGYFFFRRGKGAVDVRFYNRSTNASTQKAPDFQPNAATNMTMIATVEGEGLRAFIGSELVGIATKIDDLYFLTISSDAVGSLRFETEDGIPLTSEKPISYVADSHRGSLKSPIILRPTDDRPYKIIENNHVIIIRNNEKYDITGKKL